MSDLFSSRSSRVLALVGIVGAIGTFATSSASAFGGMHFSTGGSMMHLMGNGMHPSWGGMPQHTPVRLPPWLGLHPKPWQPGGVQISNHCGWWNRCGGHPWHPGFPWHPGGYPWHPNYPVVYHLPPYPVSAPAPVTYSTPAPAYTAPVSSTPAYTAPATYSAPAATAPAICPTLDANPEYVQVTFQSNASAIDTASFLKAYNVVVQDGPSQDGSFKLRLQTPIPQEQLGQMIDSMKSQTAVVSQATAG